MPKVLTDEAIKRLRAPRAGRKEYSDAIVRGLSLRVAGNGAKTWSYVYKVPGQGGSSQKTGRMLRGTQKRITIGTYPDTCVQKARSQAAAFVEAVLGGVDPSPERQARQRQRLANTFQAVADRYIEQEAKQRLKRWKNVERCLKQHVYPVIGSLPIESIRRADIHQLLDAQTAKGKIGVARDVRKSASVVFNWAVDREIIAQSPMVGLKRTDLRLNQEAGRALGNSELAAIWAAASEIGYPFGDYVKLLILTGQRRNEWADATRSELTPSCDALEISKARYKSGRDHIVPLSDQAQQIIRSLPVCAGPYLFSTTQGARPISGFSKSKKRLDDLAASILRQQTNNPDAQWQNYRLHDLRVTCESRLADLGFGQDVRDAVLGHAKVGLQKLYNKHQYLDEKREALDRYAATLTKQL